ncbi:MAG: pyruvate dehydrogenase (acetyl-transferring) E1 component subunit alpha [Planctomycetota bacterium]|nr:pyruvate dehydrogenase (acetyl-transferring) E1 component subunit alpha [Planctomycetota bacterium]
MISGKPATRPSDALDAAALLELLRQMMLIRRFEERTMQSYQATKIGGFCHIYIGQEATAVGSIAALRKDDPIITAYRDHGHALARGMEPKYCMAEMYGKLAGCAKGKGGSMHIFDKDNAMYGGHAIVAGQCPMGVGLAFSHAYLGEDKVTVCYLGDGALNQGAFHESMNLAAIWRLPIIFVVENNSYSMGTHISRGTAAADDLSVKAAAYGMRYAECDGMDVLDTYDTFRTLVDAMRGSSSRALGAPADTGSGPAFVNAKTYRFKGHSMSDPQKYRTKEEVAGRQERDPISTLVSHLVERNLATQEQIDAIDKQAKELSHDAEKFAEEAPALPLSELYTDVYAEPFGPYKVGELPEMLRKTQK